MVSLKLIKKNNSNKRIKTKKNMKGGLELNTNTIKNVGLATAGIGAALLALKEKEKLKELAKSTKSTKLYKMIDKIKNKTEPVVKNAADAVKWELSNKIAQSAYIFTAFGFNPDKKYFLEKIKSYFIGDDKTDKEKLEKAQKEYKFTTVTEDINYFYNVKDNKKMFGNGLYVSNEHINEVQRIACVKSFKLSRNGIIFNNKKIDNESDSKKEEERQRILRLKKNITSKDLKDGDSFDIYFNTTRGNIIIPVIIKEHLLNKKGIYLNKDKISNIPTTSNTYSSEYPVSNFINMLSTQSIAEDVLLIPCFSHDESVFDNKPNISEDNKTSDDDEGDNRETINMDLVMKDVIETINNNQIEVISNNKTIFKNETQKFGHNKPFFIKNILQLKTSPQWIDELVVQKSLDYFIDNDGIPLDNMLDIVPTIWTTSKQFKYGVGVGVGLGSLFASYYLLNNTEKGLNLQQSIKDVSINAKETIINAPEKISEKVKNVKANVIDPFVVSVKKQNINDLYEKTKKTGMNNKFTSKIKDKFKSTMKLFPTKKGGHNNHNKKTRKIKIT
jgi:hypothetical protein